MALPIAIADLPVAVLFASGTFASVFMRGSGPVVPRGEERHAPWVKSKSPLR
jgi:hypothetical protein